MEEGDDEEEGHKKRELDEEVREEDVERELDDGTREEVEEEDEREKWEWLMGVVDDYQLREENRMTDYLKTVNPQETTPQSTHTIPYNRNRYIRRKPSSSPHSIGAHILLHLKRGQVVYHR